MKKSLLASLIMSLSLFAVSQYSMAADNASPQQKAEWRKQHPRRAEVNHRLAKQNSRINRAERHGKLTPQQATSLHQQDKNIRQEEKDMAAQHRGHITKQEQKTLNQQENQVNKEIIQDSAH